MATVSATLDVKPFFLQAVPGDPAVEYTATDMRLMLGAMFPRNGVVGTGLRVSQRATGGAGWAVDVAPGWHLAGNSTDPERYLVRNPTVQTLTLTGFVTNPAATRTHRVWINVYDKSAIGSEYAAKLMITEDTGSGAPVPTDNQLFAMELATFSIAPAQANVTDANITNVVRHAGQGTLDLTIPLQSGVAGPQGTIVGGTPRYSLQGSTVTLSGVITRATGDFLSGSVYTVATLPVGFRPKTNRYCAAVGESAVPLRITINPAGQIALSSMSSTFLPPAYSHVSLDGISFELD